MAEKLPQHQGRPEAVSHFTTCMSFAASINLIVGGIGYCPWIGDVDGDFVTAAMIFILLFYGVMLLFAAASATAAWPGRAGPYFMAAATGFGLATSSTLLSPELPYVFRGLFWSLSGMYAGLLVEGVTGVCKRVNAALAASTVEAIMKAGQGKAE